MDNQCTIKHEVRLNGVGVHTGLPVNLVLKPAEVNSGINFFRVDLEGSPVVPADAQYVVDTQRSTTLKKGKASVQTTEHLLAAVWAAGVDNLNIEVDAPEMPIMNGSSRPFVDLLKEAQIEEQDQERCYFEVKEPITFRDEATGSELTAIPAEEFSCLTVIDFGKNIIGTQNAYLNSLADFEDEVCDARTFSFLHEIESMLDHGLVKGGDLNNAIIYVDKTPSEETMAKLKKEFGKEDVKIEPNGVLNNLELKYSNEASRHKLIDVVGDLVLTGKRIKGKIIAHKPGHKVNTDFAKLLQKELGNKVNVPKYDPNCTPLYDINQIKKMLPHRSPFLLLDRVFEITDNEIIASKSVTMNEPFFVGHFPTNPVMPGVLQIEAMAQAGGIFVLNGVDEPEKYLTYFMKIDNVKFKRMVVPGDVLMFHLTLLSPVRRGICHMHGKAYVGDQLACEAELLAKIVKEK